MSPSRPSVRFARFVGSGAICFGLNAAVLYVGTDIAGLHYLVSMLLSIAIATIAGWVLNRRWTFGSGDPRRARELARYGLVAGSSMGASLALMVVLVSGLGMHPVFASCAIAIAMAVVNFVAHGRLTYRVADPLSRPACERRDGR